MYEREDAVRGERNADRRDRENVRTSGARQRTGARGAHVRLVTASDGGITPDEMVRAGVFRVAPYEMLT